MKKTSYKYNYNKKAYINSIILLIIFTILFGFIAFKSFKSLIKNGLDTTDGMYIITILLPIISSLFFIFVCTGLLLHLIGYLKGKKEIIKTQLKTNITNPYIYYRELPNNYGIGIASLLLNSKIENEKDIVAIILNLCAKKYLILKKENEKYALTLIKNIDSNLLSNEKYIMTMIINNNLKDLNYDEWFNYCIQDGLNLNLFSKPKEYIQEDNIFKSIYKGGFLSSLKIYLEPTENGIKELQKLLLFKSFLEDFGRFEEKNIEEIILWDYYLCYAQVFGLTDKILETGYDKLIKNSSFEIKDLNEIHLNEITIKIN